MGAYEEIMELWQARKFFEAISCLFQSMAEGLFNQRKN